jgi:hypothetical protein
MRSIPHRVILPALVLAWALSHAAVFGGDPKDEKSAKGDRNLTPVERIRQTLDQPITLDFSGQSLEEALQHLREKTNLEFNLDQVALAVMGININDNGGQPVMLKSTGGKLSTALRKLLSSHQLTYVVFEDSILITTNELATHRQLRQRISLDVNDVPLAKALRELARNYAFNLVIDPKVGKQSQASVSLSLDGAGLETSVRLLAEMAGLKAVRMDNVLFVTTEERAEKIRKEEKDMVPNPLDDPNVIPGLPKAALGGVLNLGGVPLLRVVPAPAAGNAVPPPNAGVEPPPVEKKAAPPDGK